MATVTVVTVRVHLRPGLTLRDALALRLAGPTVRDAYVRLLEAGTERLCCAQAANVSDSEPAPSATPADSPPPEGA